MTLTRVARRLRRQQTDAERLLWAKLGGRRAAGAKFRRQQPIGPYIVDFVALEKKLVVELDGGQHNSDTVAEANQKRTDWLEARGYLVLRFWNNDVLAHTNSVVDAIAMALVEPHPHPGPLPSRDPDAIGTLSPGGRELE
ncbi:MAG: endonuclease domain-containing protein [Chloroflexi bacterium]|nr:endonuclease domain-containing protein [Chloroflexota bacterium]